MIVYGYNYGVSATNRKTKDRVMVTEAMTLREAEEWKSKQGLMLSLESKY